MKTAMEVFLSKAKKGTDPGNEEFYRSLEVNGAAGKLGKLLLWAQRRHDRLREFYKLEVQDPDFERKIKGLNNLAIGAVIDLCLQEQSRLNIIFKRFSYGIRITLRREAVIRFRHIEDFWTGDDANLQAICRYCDRIVADERTSERLGKIQSWPASV